MLRKKTQANPIKTSLRVDEALRHCWENEKRTLKDHFRHSMGPKTLHAIRRFLRRAIRISFFVGRIGRLTPASQKNLAWMKKTYRALGPWREKDVIAREWRRLLRTLPEVKTCAVLSGSGVPGGRKKCPRRKRMLVRVLKRIDRCPFPACQNDALTKTAASDFLARLQAFFSDRDAKLERLAARWVRLDPGERHRLRKIVRVLHESWALVRDLSPAIPDGDWDRLLSKLDRCLGRVHDRDVRLGKLCRKKRFSRKKGWRRALLSGWSAGRANEQFQEIGHLLKLYLALSRPWKPEVEGVFILPDGFSPTT